MPDAIIIMLIVVRNKLCHTFHNIMPLDHTNELYAVYANMKNRCYNRNHPLYKNYGMRGVKVCPDWNERVVGFSNFMHDMGARPDGYILALIHGTKMYSVDNCTWVSPSGHSFARRIRSDNKSGMKGVYFNERSHKWHATITVNKKRKHLGYFNNYEEAAQARQMAEQEAAL
jgi:hypothetical protein